MDPKSTLLIVEDDFDIADMLDSYFRVYGYEVLTVNWGDDAVRTCLVQSPDLVILDIRLPDFDGFEVARRLRADRRTQDVPIIFLTEKRGRDDRMKGMQLQAVDYITKPFDLQELRLQVRNALRHTGRAAQNNTVTGLPEGNLVDERLRECLNDKNWSALVVELENFNVFREAYGFVATDDLERAVAMMLHDSLQEVAIGPNDFLGHLGQIIFLLLVEPDALSLLKESIQHRMNSSSDYFYRIADYKAEKFSGKKLTLRFGELAGTPTSFEDLDQLKNALFLLIKGD